jgi:hypothetical protein
MIPEQSIRRLLDQEGGNRPKSRNGGAGIASLAPPFHYFR